MVEPDQIIAADPRLDHLDALRARYHVGSTTDNLDAATRADILVLSVKPQVLDEVLHEVRSGARTCSLVVSIVAGAPIKKIADGLANACVVRVMPNTPARIGQGISVWTATAEVPETQREQARMLLQAFGEEIFVKESISIWRSAFPAPPCSCLWKHGRCRAPGFSRHIAEKR
jgi:pyrroline-5-carboxylate reductase